MVTHIYKIQTEILVLLPKNFGSPKTSELWCNFRQLCDLSANVSGTEQDIVKHKTALQAAITPTHDC